MSVSISIAGIAKSYVKGKTVLAPLDLEIAAGEFFFLLGPSGCGKSTLLRILSGLLEADGGSISFNGRRIDGLDPEKRRAAMVFQNYALWPHLSVYENVAFGLKSAKIPKKEIREKVMEALELVRMADYADRRVPSLSGGQQQRVALARAVVVSPAVLLLDEPLSNLDARLRDVMRAEIRRVTKERGLTAIYVTHDRKEAMAMADRMAVLNEGKLAQVGTPEELYRNPATRFVAEFLGDVNFFPAEIADGKATCAQGVFELAADNAFCGRGTLAFRPESLRPAEAGDTKNRLRARVVERIYAGESTQYLLDAGGVEVRYSEPGQHPPRSGEPELFLPGEAIQVIGDEP